MDCLTYLKEAKLKVTKGRVCIMGILFESSDALTAETVLESCRAIGMSLDLSTVYRTLELFNEKHIVDKFDLGNGKYSYVIRRDEHKHLLECSLCHKEVEIDCPMCQIEQIIKNKTGFMLMEHELKIKGICEECKDEMDVKKKK